MGIIGYLTITLLFTLSAIVCSIWILEKILLQDIVQDIHPPLLQQIQTKLEWNETLDDRLDLKMELINNLMDYFRKEIQ